MDVFEIDANGEMVNDPFESCDEPDFDDCED